jgi:hypothetical protein
MLELAHHTSLDVALTDRLGAIGDGNETLVWQTPVLFGSSEVCITGQLTVRPGDLCTGLQIYYRRGPQFVIPPAFQTPLIGCAPAVIIALPLHWHDESGWIAKAGGGLYTVTILELNANNSPMPNGMLIDANLHLESMP